MKVLPLKIKISSLAIVRIFLNPLYLLLAVLLGLLGLFGILWAFNINLFWFIVSASSLSLTDRLRSLLLIYESLGTNFETMPAILLSSFSVLLGINLSALIYILKRRAKAFSQAGKTAGGLVAAIVGAGCAACGTSILTPLLAAAGAGSSISLINTFGLIINILSIAMMLFSIYSLGKLAANIHAASG